MIASRQTQPRRSRLFPEMYKPKPWWQAGMVELKFRENVRPQVLEWGVESLTGADLKEFHRLAKKWNVQHVRHAVKMSYEEADRLQEVVRRQGKEAAHLNHFITLHFDRNAPVEDIAAEFGKLECIEHAGLARLSTGSTLPNDPFLGTDDEIHPNGLLENQWYIFHCHADKAWDITLNNGDKVSGKGVAIAVIDQAFYADHEDLKDNVKQRHNAFTGDANLSGPGAASQRDLRHGTGAAGLAAARGNNNVGIAGFAPQADLWLVQALHIHDPNQPNDQPQNRVPDGLIWAGQQAAAASPARTVISASIALNATPISPQLPIDVVDRISTIIDAAIIGIDTRAVVCIAAGNDEKDSMGKDVSIDENGKSFGSNAIVVGAMYVDAHDNVRFPTSNWGPRVTVCAPGDRNHDMTCSTPDENYRIQYGQTSGATPKVAGTIALMLQANPNLSHDQIKAILNGTGKKLARLDYERPVGPMLDTLAAVTAAQVPQTGPKLIANSFLNFGKVDRDTTSAPQRVNLFNIGVAPITLDPVQPKPGSSSDFKIMAQSGVPGTIQPGGSASIDIAFAPSSRKDVDATFLLSSNSLVTPIEIQCTGTAPWTLLGKLELAGGIVVGAAGIIALVLYIAGRRNKS